MVYLQCLLVVLQVVGKMTLNCQILECNNFHGWGNLDVLLFFIEGLERHLIMDVMILTFVNQMFNMFDIPLSVIYQWC